MNLLAVGGLLALGVLALIALIFVIRDDSGKATNVSTPPAVPIEQEETITHPVADEPSIATRPIPEADQSALPISEELPVNEWHPSANGQMYELVNELRHVRGQVRELERRLSELMDMVEHGERAQEKPIAEKDKIHDAAEI